MPSQSSALIFDLDGTITDSKAGILVCLRKLIEAHQFGDQGDLERFIGPPIEEWVKILLPNGTSQEHTALADEYRAYYDREGWCDNAVFAGVKEMLEDLRRKGFSLYLCTSKRQNFAERILDLFGLLTLFSAIYGDKPEYASRSKIDLLGNLLREQNLDRATTWMIGDRCFDIEAAHANNLRCVAAGWGYGTPEEHAEADAVAATPADVAALVLQENQQEMPPIVPAPEIAPA
jgi:phosphoglycolate phosphatase